MQWNPTADLDLNPKEGSRIKVIYEDGVQETVRYESGVVVRDDGTHRYVRPVFWAPVPEHEVDRRCVGTHRPLLKTLLSANVIRRCECGTMLHTNTQIIDHYTRGHFDRPIFEYIDSPGTYTIES